MDILTIAKLVFGIISTISISGFVIWWFIQLGANTLADNYKKRVEHEFEKKLEGYKSQLEVLKATTLKYNDRQFELYITLWKSLQELKFACIDLWEGANRMNLRRFKDALRSTYREIETTSILLEEQHYKELSEIITNLTEYNFGKQRLIDARSQDIPEQQIIELIDYNRERKDRCLIIIETLKQSIKNTIKGDTTAS